MWRFIQFLGGGWLLADLTSSLAKHIGQQPQQQRAGRSFRIAGVNQVIDGVEYQLQICLVSDPKLFIPQDKIQVAVVSKHTETPSTNV